MARFSRAALAATMFFLVMCTSPAAAAFGEQAETFFRFLGLSTNESRPPKDKIEIIGAGFGRTGTTSLMAALNQLGYPCYHMVEISANGHERLVMDAFSPDDKAIDRWFNAITQAGFSATVDFPTCMFYEYQMKKYPEAPVILTVRDSEKWFKSYDSLMNMAKLLSGAPFRWIFREKNEFFSKTIGYSGSKYGVAASGCNRNFHEIEQYSPWYAPWISYPINNGLNKTACINFFEKHNRDVEAIVPKSRLVKMQISEGWKPICEALGIPIPKTPFPRDNSSEVMQARAAALEFICKFYPFIILAALATVYLLFVGIRKCVTSANTKPKQA